MICAMRSHFRQRMPPAALYRRVGMSERARALCARHVALWRDWEARLPKTL